MDLDTVLPPRSLDDVIAQRVRLRVGGQDYLLPQLRIPASEAWKRSLDAEMSALLGRAGEESDPGAVLSALSTDAQAFVDLIRSYDELSILPGDFWEQWTQMDLLCAVLEVWRAENPLVDIGLTVWTTTQTATMASAERTRRWRRNTAGPSPTSVPN